MKYQLYILCALTVASCTSQNEDSFEFDLSKLFNQINFDAPEVGQVSTYIHFEGSNFGATNSSINYTADTLVVSLITKSGNVFTFQERITEGSTVNSIPNSYIDGHDMLKTSEWAIISDSLVFTGGETFLFWLGRQALPFTLSDDATNRTLITWGTNSNSFGSPFNITSGKINDFNYNDIIGAYDVLDIPEDGDGFEVLYNRPFGVMRSSTFGPQTLAGFGWDLQLEN